MMLYILLTLCILLLLVFCTCLSTRLRKMHAEEKTQDLITTEVLRNVAAYMLLIDDDFNVLRTNYYAMNQLPTATTPPKVGNLLRCRNGEDAGLCGTHEFCATCPVRAAIADTFRTHKNFNKLEAEMVVYTSPEHTSTRTSDLLISGNYFLSGNDPRMVLTVYDITQQKKIQKELEAARLQAEEADRMKSLFLANTSHELRTPLNAIVGFSELLAADDTTPEERAEYVHIIRTNNELLLQLVNDTLDLSKIEAGTLIYKYADTELNALMNELLGVFRMKQPEENHVEITFEQKYPACHFRTDPQRLMQVMSNLLSNACKFTHQGSIRFGYDLHHDEIRFYCIDTGNGITPEQQKSLFKRFSKISNYKQGVGIGLAISKSIVETMGGHVGVKSELGKGASFWFTLPYPSCEPTSDQSIRPNV